MIEPAVIDVVLRALPDPVALLESAVRRGRMQHRLQCTTPAFSTLATGPRQGVGVSVLGLGAAGEVICNLPPAVAESVASPLVNSPSYELEHVPNTRLRAFDLDVTDALAIARLVEDDVAQLLHAFSS